MITCYLLLYLCVIFVRMAISGPSSAHIDSDNNNHVACYVLDSNPTIFQLTKTRTKYKNSTKYNVEKKRDICI